MPDWHAESRRLRGVVAPRSRWASMQKHPDSPAYAAALYTAPSTLTHDRAVLPSRSSDGLELSSWLPSSRAEFEASAFGSTMLQLAELMGPPSSECLVGSRDVLGFCEPESDASVAAREHYSVQLSRQSGSSPGTRLKAIPGCGPTRCQAPAGAAGARWPKPSQAQAGACQRG